MNEALLQKLDAIEAEMKRIGYWTADTTEIQAKIARGEVDNYLDFPSFDLWLQTVFLPNARKRIQENDLPKTSNVGVAAMRQYDYMEEVYEAHPLMNLLSEFDGLIEAQQKK